jgi:predicted lysophospholipase L1 biosynthesis ABC-type transport system permease subunit
MGGDRTSKDMVIGVVGDAHINALGDDDAVEQYWPAQPADMPDMVLIARAEGEPGSLAPVAKAIATALDPSVFPEVRQLELLYRKNVQQIETGAAIVSVMGMVAVILAGIGLLGLVGYVVTQRTKEIAIRLALGAQPFAVLNAVLQQFRWPLFVGLAGGTALAAFGSKLLRVALYGVDNLDWASYLAALLMLGAIAALAMVLPAARTLRLNVAAILHHD